MRAVAFPQAKAWGNFRPLVQVADCKEQARNRKRRSLNYLAVLLRVGTDESLGPKDPDAGERLVNFVGAKAVDDEIDDWGFVGEHRITIHFPM